MSDEFPDPVLSSEFSDSDTGRDKRISGSDIETILFEDSVQTTAYYERKIRRMQQINFQTLRLVYISRFCSASLM
jgi:hypothetical protein